MGSGPGGASAARRFLTRANRAKPATPAAAGRGGRIEPAAAIPSGVAHSVSVGCPGASGRLRERRQSAYGASRGAVAGDGLAGLDRRGPMAADPIGVGGERVT